MKVRLRLVAPLLKFGRLNRCVPPARSFLAGAIVVFSLVLSGCGGGSGSNGAQTFTVVLTPTSPAIAVGGTEQFTGGTVENGTSTPVNTPGLTYAWSSSNPSVASINATTGLATALSVGTTMIEVMATNSENNGVGMDITMLKVVNPLSTVMPPLPIGALTIPYPATTLGGGGATPLTWSVVNGTALPAGLTLSASGSLGGTPTVLGTSPNVTVQVTDSETPPASKQLTFNITTIDPTNPCNVVMGGNEAILNGQYAFLLQGFQATTANGAPAAMAGSFFANGTGGIIAGEVNLNNASSATHLTINAGNYAVNLSGQGCVQLKYTSGASNVFHFALSQVLNTNNVATYGRMIEFDGYQGTQGGASTMITTGVLMLQNPAEFSALASRFAFGMDGFDMAGKHVALGGSFNFSNATDDITNFAEDVDDGGTISTVTGASGTSGTGPPDFNGGAGITLTLPGPTTVYMALYVVNANEMFLVSMNPLSATFPIYSGRAIVTSGSYSASSLSGNYIYRAEGVDYQGDGVACAASGPCALTEVAVMNANAGTGAIGGTLYQLQNGATQTSTITNTYSVDSATGRLQLSSTGSAKLPVLYLATPVTGTDATESIAAFLMGSGPTPNSSSGDPTALFGLIEAQPNGPYSLNSPPAYIFASEDMGQISSGAVVGYGTFSSGTISNPRDISNNLGLTLNEAGNSFSFTPNADGTVSGTVSGPSGSGTLVGATNSTLASPGKVFFVPNSSVAGIRLLEP